MKFALCFFLCVVAGYVVSSKTISVISTLDSLNRLLSVQLLLKDTSRQGMVKGRSVRELQREMLIPSSKSKKVLAVCMIKTWMTLVKEFFNRLLNCSKSCVNSGEMPLIWNIDGLSKATDDALNNLGDVTRKCPDNRQTSAGCSRSEPNCTSCKKEAPLILRDIRRVVTVASKFLKNGCLNCTGALKSVKKIWNKVTAEQHLQDAKNSVEMCPPSQGQDQTSGLPQTSKAEHSSLNKEAPKTGRGKKGKKQRKRKAGQKKSKRS